VKTVVNGQRFLLQNGTTQILLGVFSGNAYEIGVAYGQLFKEEMNANYEGMLDWVSNTLQTWPDLPSYLTWLHSCPVWVIKLLCDLAMNLELAATFHYTPPRWEQEFAGMAVGSGISDIRIQNINLIPEVTRASCSIIGTWGPATLDNALLHLRALDWDPSAPMNYNPMIAIYNFDGEDSQVFANFGWAGITGSLAGFSQKIGIGERLWGDKGEVTAYGQPWMYVLRDTLQYGTNIETALSVIYNANRTWAIYVGLSSVEDNQLEIVQYAAKQINIISTTNFTSPCPAAHPQIDGVLYIDKYGMGACNPCVGDSIMSQYGSITAEYLYTQPAALSQTGDTLLAVYDFNSMFVYISFSDPSTSNPAWNRSLMALDMNLLFGYATTLASIELTE
jgi:hypothetical protein